METDVLVFEVDERQFGVSAAFVKEVLRAVTPLPLPRAPQVVMGMINLRGQVVPVINTRTLLGISPVDVRHTDHFVVVRDRELTYAIHVDRAIDLSRVQIDSSADIRNGSNMDDRNQIGLIANTSLGFVQVLDPARLLGDQDRAAVAAIASSTTETETPT